MIRKTKTSQKGRLVHTEFFRGYLTDFCYLAERFKLLLAALNIPRVNLKINESLYPLRCLLLSLIRFLTTK
jgi:hypothetical protein